jgi:hypothetical protein
LNGMIEKVFEEMDPCVLLFAPSYLLKTPKYPSTTSKKIIMSAAKKRKTVTASRQFATVFAHDPGSFQQRITLNTKCQNTIGKVPLYNYPPRHELYGNTIRNFLGANVMRNESITMQAKCISSAYSTDRHKDSKN